MTQPLISIAVCTYNTGNYLKPLLESLVNQTWQNLEIVCCDDNSSDGTLQQLLYFQDQFPSKIKVFPNDENIGYNKNFEKALSLCRGSLIAIADHDDIWMQHKIEALACHIDQAMLVYCDSVYIDSEGKETGRKLTTKFNLHNHPDPRSFAFTNTVWGHTAMIKKSLLQHALPLPEGIPYDIWIAYVASNLGGIRYVPEALTCWRQHTGSFSAVNYDNKKPEDNPHYKEWQSRMHWLQLIAAFPNAKHAGFLKKLAALYERKQHVVFVWPLFFFLLKNNAVLFKVWRRSAISRLNEFRKIATGVRKK